MGEISKLKDVCEINGGYAFKSTQYRGKGTPLIRIGDISEKLIEISDGTVYIEDDINKYEKFIIKKGDILIALSGATTGKFGRYNYDEVALLNQRVAKIYPNKFLYNGYLFYYMNKLKDIIYSKALGCAQPNISPTEIGELEIYIPDLETQKKIVEILDKAHWLIDKRKEQIGALDELVKSRFIELFGSKDKFEYIKIEELVKHKSDIVDGPFGSNLKTIDYVGDGVRVIQINNIGECDFRDKNKRFVTEEKFNSLIKHSVIPGDIVVAKMGEPIGRACILPDYIEKAVIVADCMKIHPNTEIVNTKYLEFLLNTEEVKSQFKKYSQGSTRVRLNLTMLRQVKVLYPSIELQNEFADFVTQVDKLKFEMEKSLKELEDNFNSLMQRAFKGELFK